MSLGILLKLSNVNENLAGLALPDTSLLARPLFIVTCALSV